MSASNKPQSQFNFDALRAILIAVTLIALILVVYFLHVFSSCYLYSRFQNAIKDLYSSELPIAEALEDPRFQYSLARQNLPSKDILGLLGSIQTSDYEAAQGFLRGRGRLLDPALGLALGPILDRAVKAKSNHQQITAQETLARQEEARICSDYNSIQADAALMLGTDIEHNPLQPATSLATISFYTDIPLNDIPFVPLPADELKTKEDLKRRLEKTKEISGAFSEETKAEDLVRRFENIRPASVDIQKRIRILEKKKISIGNDKLQIEEELKNLHSNLLKQLITYLANKLKPSSVAKYESIYNRVGNSLTLFGFHIPPIVKTEDLVG